MNLKYAITRFEKGFVFKVYSISEEFASFLRNMKGVSTKAGFEVHFGAPVGISGDFHNKDAKDKFIILSGNMPISGYARVMNLKSNEKRDKVIKRINASLAEAVDTFKYYKRSQAAIFPLIMLELLRPYEVGPERRRASVRESEAEKAQIFVLR